MKKLIYIVVYTLTIMSAISCSHKKYFVIENCAHITDTMYGINGTLYDVNVMCYVNDDPADVIYIESIKPDTTSGKILIPSNTTKVKITYGIAPNSSFEKLGIPSSAFRQELAGYRFTEYRTTVFRFDNNTMTK